MLSAEHRSPVLPISPQTDNSDPDIVEEALKKVRQALVGQNGTSPRHSLLLCSLATRHAAVRSVRGWSRHATATHYSRYLSDRPGCDALHGAQERPCAERCAQLVRALSASHPASVSPFSLFLAICARSQ